MSPHHSRGNSERTFIQKTCCFRGAVVWKALGEDSPLEPDFGTELAEGGRSLPWMPGLRILQDKGWLLPFPLSSDVMNSGAELHVCAPTQTPTSLKYKGEWGITQNQTILVVQSHVILWKTFCSGQKEQSSCQTVLLDLGLIQSPGKIPSNHRGCE